MKSKEIRNKKILIVRIVIFVGICITHIMTFSDSIAVIPENMQLFSLNYKLSYIVTFSDSIAVITEYITY